MASSSSSSSSSNEDRSVLYLAVARRDDRCLLACQPAKLTDTNSPLLEDPEYDYKENIQKVLSSPGWASISSDKLSLEDNQRLFHLMLDEEGRVYIAITSKAYPSRLVYPTSNGKTRGLLGDLVDEIQQKFSDLSLTCKTMGLQKQCKQSLTNLLKKYNDLKAMDKLTQVQGKVDEVKGVVRESVDKALQNTDKVDALDDKTQQLQSSAHRFQQGSTALRRKMQIRYYKLMCIFGLLIMAVLAYIIFPIIINNT